MGYPTHIDCDKHGPEQPIVWLQGGTDYMCRRCYFEDIRRFSRYWNERARRLAADGPVVLSRVRCDCAERIKRLEAERDGYLRALILACYHWWDDVFDWRYPPRQIAFDHLREAGATVPEEE